MNDFNKLDLDIIKKQIISYTNFSKGRQIIEELDVLFNPLIIKSNTNRSRQALQLVVKYGSMPFLGVKDISSVLTNASKDMILKSMDFLDIVSLNDGIKGCIRYTYNWEEEYEYIQDLTNTLIYHKELNEKILNIITPYGEVKKDATTKLKDLNKQLNSVENQIIKATNKFINDNSDIIQEKIISYRSNRACLLIKNTNKNTFNGLIHGDTKSKQASYVEPDFLVGLNNIKLNIIEEINEEIDRILFDLSQDVKLCSNDLLSNIETLGVLDAIFAKAVYGYNNQGIIANIDNNNHLYIKDARHPLIDKDKVISNTYELVNTYKLLLITGANTGGKTISLKIIGLFVTMTYMGIPVFANECNIPIYDQILVDISEQQSVTASLSSFSAHLSKLSHITNNATSKSLVLLDEIGSATDPLEGEALAIATLDYLRNVGCLTICTTHFNGLKSYASKYDNILLASVEFDKKDLKPTYRFLEGVIGQSNAFDIAKRYNIKEEIINNAITIKENNKSEDMLLLSKLENLIQENNELKILLNNKQEDLNIKEKTLELKENKLYELENDLINEAKDKSLQYINDIKQKANAILDELKLEDNRRISKVIESKTKLDELVENKTLLSDSIEEFKVHDLVYLNDANNVCEILSINKNNCVLLMNNMKVNAKLKQLKKANIVKQIKKVNNKRSEMVIKKINLECNIIGLTSADARDVLSKYIDDALVANQKTCRIVHGMGTGVLRKMTHEYLKKHSSIKEYHLADYHDGGSGATVVVFK